MLYKSEKEKCFAYSAHTACEERGFIVSAALTSANVHDSTMLKTLVENIVDNLDTPEYVVVDAGYRTSANAHMLKKHGIQGVMPYKNNRINKEIIPKSKFIYDSKKNVYICPESKELTLRTIDRNGYKQYKAGAKICSECSRYKDCVSKSSKTRTITRHVWADALDEVDRFRLTTDGKMIYSARKETIERDFADCKEQHAMRYTRLRGKDKVEQEMFLTFACFNLKKMIRIMKKAG